MQLSNYKFAEVAMIVIYRNNNNCILIEGKSLNSLWEQPKVTSTFFISGSGLDEIVENTILPDDIKPSLSPAAPAMNFV